MKRLLWSTKFLNQQKAYRIPHRTQQSVSTWLPKTPRHNVITNRISNVIEPLRLAAIPLFKARKDKVTIPNRNIRVCVLWHTNTKWKVAFEAVTSRVKFRPSAQTISSDEKGKLVKFIFSVWINSRLVTPHFSLGEDTQFYFLISFPLFFSSSMRKQCWANSSVLFPFFLFLSSSNHYDSGTVAFPIKNLISSIWSKKIIIWKECSTSEPS